MASPRPNCCSLLGLDPSGSGQREFWIEKDLIQYFYKLNWMDKYKGLYSVKEVLASPAVVFQGLERDGQETALCYAGLAANSFSRDGNPLPPPPGMTFVVYVRSDDVVYRWDWEIAASNLTYPNDFQNRFGKQLWPKV